ncbi:hypothetical protein P7L64_17750 [Tistrella bauzanensis]|nr:hypothetical protein [Tistrella bauzanensis]
MTEDKQAAPDPAPGSGDPSKETIHPADAILPADAFPTAVNDQITDVLLADAGDAALTPAGDAGDGAAPVAGINIAVVDVVPEPTTDDPADKR